MWLLVLLMIVSIISQGFIPVLQEKVAPEGIAQATLITVVTSTLAALLFLPVTLAVNNFQLPDTTLLIWGAILLAAILYAVANLTFFWLPSRVGAPVFGTVFTLRIVPMTLLSILLISETMTWLKATGMLLIVIGIIWATWRRQMSAHLQWLAIVGLAIGAAAFGSATAIDVYIVKEIGTSSYIPLRLFLPAVILSVALAFFTRSEKITATFDRQRIHLIGYLALLIPISASTLLLAMQLNTEPAALNAIHQLSLFVTIFIGALASRTVISSLKKYLLPALICWGGVALALLT